MGTHNFCAVECKVYRYLHFPNVPIPRTESNPGLCNFQSINYAATIMIFIWGRIVSTLPNSSSPLPNILNHNRPVTYCGLFLSKNNSFSKKMLLFSFILNIFPLYLMFFIDCKVKKRLLYLNYKITKVLTMYI